METIIYHFVFIVIALWGFAWALFLKQKCEDYKNSLLPALLCENIQLPRDRSILVRSFNFLQQELRGVFQVDVTLHLPSDLAEQSLSAFLQPLCYFIVKAKSQAKIFNYQGEFYSPQELLQIICKLKNKSQLHFKYNANINLWSLELFYEK